MLRRTRVLFVAAGLVLAVHACTPDESDPGRTRAGEERAYSVQLHVHGSFSEGVGSLDSHGYEASDVGCDVVWWSDHDFRITSYEHVSRFGFEDWDEPLERNEPWRTHLRKYQGDKKRVRVLSWPQGAAAAFVPEPACEGAHSLRLAASSAGSEFEPLTLVFGAERRLQCRSLATGVTLHL